MNESWGLKEAAAFLKIHPDTLAERARAGEIPGCKIGRAWVFMPELLSEYLRTRSTEKYETTKRVGWNVAASLTERLANRLAQQSAGKKTAATLKRRRLAALNDRSLHVFDPTCEDSAGSNSPRDEALGFPLPKCPNDD
jgi:excisionase family DNA binding protein